MPKKRVLVPIAPGFEELEAVAAIDVLRRAGAHVVTVSVAGTNPIVGRNRIRLMTDLDLPEALEEWGDEWDMVVLPGGPAVAKLAEDEALMGLLKRRIAAGSLTGAICAAPKLLAAAGLDRATAVTNFPGCREDLADFGNYSEDRVVVAGNIVTSRGAGTATEFGLACVGALFGADKQAEIKAQIVG